MNYRILQVLTILIPTLLIGGFEYIRHKYLLYYISMKTGNWYITLLTFILSFLFSVWMFRKIRQINERLMEEQARRAIYEERERIAKELHDGIAQSLFFLNIKLKQGAVDEAYKSVAEIDKNVRQAIFNLRSIPEEGGSFSARIEKWVSEWSAFTSIEVNQVIDLPDHFFQASEEVQLFSIIQEAFMNIRKHANASQVDLHFLADSQGGWKLSISDNGKGVQKQKWGSNQYGLTMMKDRASKLRATLQIRESETGGTELLALAKSGGK